MLEKKCSACERVEPVSNFYKDAHKRDGLFSACKMCCFIRKRLFIESASDEQRERRKEHKRKVDQEYRAVNLHKVLAQKREYYVRNKEKIAERREQNKDKIAEYMAEYRRANRGLFRNHISTRKKNLKQRTFPEQVEAIKDFYQNCPEGFHVDHIVPITHPLVSGLHVLANLQYLPARENSSKRNKFEIEG
jgi:hypothetical protein